MIEPVKYEQVHNGCWVACLAGLTGVSHELLSSLVPTDISSAELVAKDDIWIKYANSVNDTMMKHGWVYANTMGRIPKGFAIGVGVSPRGFDHAVIVKDGELWHDPHESKAGIVKYKYFEVMVPIVGLLNH